MTCKTRTYPHRSTQIRTWIIMNHHDFNSICAMMPALPYPIPASCHPVAQASAGEAFYSFDLPEKFKDRLTSWEVEKSANLVELAMYFVMVSFYLKHHTKPFCYGSSLIVAPLHLHTGGCESCKVSKRSAETNSVSEFFVHPVDILELFRIIQ